MYLKNTCYQKLNFAISGLFQWSGSRVHHRCNSDDFGFHLPSPTLLGGRYQTSHYSTSSLHVLCNDLVLDHCHCGCGSQPSYKASWWRKGISDLFIMTNVLGLGKFGWVLPTPNSALLQCPPYLKKANGGIGVGGFICVQLGDSKPIQGQWETFWAIYGQGP